MTLKFPYLEATDVEVRVSRATDKGVALLLYKDARCDMRILDAVVGPMNWQRSHEFKDGRLYCTVSIWDDEKKQWISKEDVGTESNAEPEKGQSSDSFKRACFNWGIGRELYTAPFIWVPASKVDIVNKKTNDKFKVRHMKVDNGVITNLIIDNVSKKVQAFQMINNTQEPQKTSEKSNTMQSEPLTDKQIKYIYATANDVGINNEALHSGIMHYFKKESVKDLNKKEMDFLIEKLTGRKAS